MVLYLYLLISLSILMLFTKISIQRPYKYLIKDKYELKGSHLFTYEGIWRHLISFFDSPFEVREQSGHSLKSSFKVNLSSLFF